MRSAVLMGYLNGCAPSCYCAPMICVLVPQGRAARRPRPSRNDRRQRVTISATIATKAADSLFDISHISPCLTPTGDGQLVGRSYDGRPINPSNLDLCCFAAGSFSAARLFGSNPSRSPKLANICAC